MVGDDDESSGVRRGTHGPFGETNDGEIDSTVTESELCANAQEEFAPETWKESRQKHQSHCQLLRAPGKAVIDTSGCVTVILQFWKSTRLRFEIKREQVT